jgi:membrane dipeptidase
MHSKVLKGLTVVLFVLGAAWLSIGSFSDYLVGNRKMQAETPTCDDASWCDTARDLFIADAHNDTLMHRDPSWGTKAGHVDLDRLVNGGVDLQVFAVASVAPKIENRDGIPCGNLSGGDRLSTYFPLKEPLRPATWLSPMGRVDRMIERFDKAMGRYDQSGPKLVQVASKADLDALDLSGTSSGVGAVLAIEGAYWASEDKDELLLQFDRLQQAGVRMIGLTHRSSNQLAGSNEDCWDKHGLTDLGRFAVAEVWKRGMVLDLAHASSETIANVADMSSAGGGGPVVVSHTGIGSACEHDRNLSDEDLRNVARSGGVVSLGFWTTVNCIEGSVTLPEARQAIARTFGIAYQILSAPDFAEEMGPRYNASEHIALGSDFDGATLVPADVSAIPWYLEGIARFETDGQPLFDYMDIENIAGRNLLRLIRGALEKQ